MTRNLQDLIEDKKAKVCVMVVGYVGLPLSIAIARAGYTVFCGDVSEEKINLLNSGLSPLPELKEIDGDELKRLVEKKRIVVSNPPTATGTNIKIICVPTPMFSDKSPDLSSVKSAAKTIGKTLRRGDLVVAESSVGPGTTRKVICQVLEENSGLKAGQDFYVVASPERIDPGNSEYTVETIPKIMGGIDDASLGIGKSFYQKFLKGGIITVSSLEAAEATKMLENSYRALNIGFINEFAKFCDASSIDILEVIKAASTKWSFQPHYPGIGVGGHCITKDPYYLISAAEEAGVELRTLQSALWSNESMPLYVFNSLQKSCDELGLELKTSKVALFGIAYKGNTRDIRNSPALTFHRILEREGIDAYVYDPLFTETEMKTMGLELFKPKNEQCDIVVIGCDHPQFRSFDFKQIKSLKLIIDGRNILPKQDVPVTGVGTNPNLRR
ncbi:MAG: nucleotide sugar dehydrogenase [Candidatus Tectomicrobia bacterium]|uniref:Nucleotide sugar dehydrogenase n=1 Tax=Tectimicrobiota bacterium TaxID=2528274 RepID=A0A933GPH2_UNCTE|nr:nucleotide sugar dehydrogenase [Candidatus Tectomicrobia bacterium]